MKNSKTMVSLNELTELCREHLQQVFAAYLQDIPAPELKSAMTYALSRSGKQLRPLIIYAVGYLFAAPWESLAIPASAVELVHTYSLIHDDLPCMDNADLRRGHPTCHKVFGNDMAVLTGDALHTLAMQILAGHPGPLTAHQRIAMINTLSQACGAAGMAGGQALDIRTQQHAPLTLSFLEKIYQLKTGALLSACFTLGRLCSPEEKPAHGEAMAALGQAVGLAFQIQDDILDCESETALLGKPQGIDQRNAKVTYPLLYGLDPAKEKVQALYEEAQKIISSFGGRGQLLNNLITVLLQRRQ